MNRKKLYSYSLVKSSSGWGYDILRSNRIFIHQDYVPILPDRKGFSTQEEAKKAAGLVITKLEHNKPPTLTYRELSQICHWMN